MYTEIENSSVRCLSISVLLKNLKYRLTPVNSAIAQKKRAGKEQKKSRNIWL